MDGTLIFWGVALATGLMVAALLVRPLLLRMPDALPGAEDLRVYRDQLAEVDRDLSRGTLAPDEAERLRTEVSRRLLEADRRRAAAATGRLGSAPAVFVILLAIGAALAVYARLGVPDYPDLPLAGRIALSEEIRANRPSQAEAQAETPAEPLVEADPAFLDLMEKLRAAVAERPGDARGLALLARNEAALGNLEAAETAQRALLDALGDQATAEDHASLAELMIRRAGGYVSPEAESRLVEALRRDPANGPARYYSGLMFLQIGRPDQTYRIWRPLLYQSPPDAPWVAPIRDQIEEVAALAGVRFTLPEAAPGPDAAAIAAAEDMSPEDRQAMIRGMVDQLSDRLSTQGGPAADWARLIASLGVLGETDRARAVWTEAQQRFADRPADLDQVRAAAQGAGLLP